MNQHKQSSDLDLGRGWLTRADSLLGFVQEALDKQHLPWPPDVTLEFTRVAATIGNGFVALAHAERAMRSSATLDAAAERVRRAAAEARPHDDEPVNLCETDADMAARFAGQVGELTSRIEDALSWLDEPDDATPEIQLAKIRAALTGETRRG